MPKIQIPVATFQKCYMGNEIFFAFSAIGKFYATSKNCSDDSVKYLKHGLQNHVQSMYMRARSERQYSELLRNVRSLTPENVMDSWNNTAESTYNFTFLGFTTITFDAPPD